MNYSFHCCAITQATCCIITQLKRANAYMFNAFVTNSFSFGKSHSSGFLHNNTFMMIRCVSLLPLFTANLRNRSSSLLWPARRQHVPWLPLFYSSHVISIAFQTNMKAAALRAEPQSSNLYFQNAFKRACFRYLTSQQQENK